MAAHGGRGGEAVFAVASNPEFLREGEALFDSFYPDRIVLGVDDAWAGDILDELYRPLAEQSFRAPDGLPRPDGFRQVPVFRADRVSVEMIKYAANAFLATKISFANEMARISELVGADVTRVMDGIGMDRRIGRAFLNAGIGYGGSCFGKDLSALVHTAREYGYEPQLIESTRAVNREQRETVIRKLQGALKTLKGRRIAILGLSFKPGTDDLRDAPSEFIVRTLTAREARVVCYDPVAMPNAERQWTDLDVRFAPTAADALAGSDAAVLVTEWPEFLTLAWPALKDRMAQPLILDGRNALDARAMRAAGFDYIGIGR